METIVDGVRIGDRERDAVARALGDHYAAGRLETAEFESRLELANRAKTQRDLDTLMRDLPGHRRRRSSPRPAARVPIAFVVLAVVAVGFVVGRGAPPFFLIPLVWFLVVRPWRRRWNRTTAHAWHD